MARILTAISTTDRIEGRYTSPAITPRTLESTVRVSIDASDWTADPTELIEFGIERSFDGGASWQLWFSTIVTPGGRSQEGRLSFVRVFLEEGDAFPFRAFLTLPKRRTVGLIIETQEGQRPVKIGPGIPQSWAYVQKTQGESGGSAVSTTCALTGVAAGNCLVLGASVWSNSAQATSVAVSDTVNGAWTSALFVPDTNVSVAAMRFFPNCGAGNPTITVTPAPGGGFYDLWVSAAEFSGGATASPLSGTPTTSAGGTSPATTTAMTPADNDVLLAAIMTYNSFSAITENAGGEGFTLIFENNDGSGQPGSFVYKIISGAPGTPAHTWTLGSSALWAAGIAAFKPAAAAGEDSSDMARRNMAYSRP